MKELCALWIWKLCGFYGFAGFQWSVDTWLGCVLEAQDGTVVDVVWPPLFLSIDIHEHFWL